MKSKIIILKFQLSIFLFFCFSGYAAHQVPAGFESLLSGQTEQLEIALAGRSLGLFTVEVKPDSVILSNPDAVLTAMGLPPLSPKDLQILRDALIHPLNRNGQLACNGTDTPGCGYIATDSVAAILDESRGALLLFMNPAWLAANSRDTRWYSPSPSESAFIHQQTLNFSGDRQGESLSVSGAGALGLGERRYLAGDWVMSRSRQDDHSTHQQWVNNLYARQDIGNRQYLQVGRMDQRNLYSPLGGSFSFTQLPLVDFYGVRAGSTEAYVNHEKDTDATPVLVQTNNNARVDIYRGNQLLGSQYLSPGLQPLDTRSLPSGSYPLELRIYEGGVLQRTEQQPFSKTGSGLNSRTQWFLQAGVPEAEQGGSDEHEDHRMVGAAGLTLNLFRTLQMTSGVSMAGSQAWNETRLETQQALPEGVLDMSASLLTGSDGSRGDTEQLTYNDGFSASIWRYRVRGADCDRDVQQETTPQVSGCSTSLSGSISVPLAGWSVSLGYSESQTDSRTQSAPAQNNPATPDVPYRQSASRSENWQLSLSRSYYWQGYSLSTRLGLFHNQGNGTEDQGGFTGVTLSRNSQPPVTTGSDSYTSVGVDWRGGAEEQMSYNVNHTRMWQQDPVYRELAMNVSGYNNDNLTGSLSGRVNGRYGDLNGTLSDSKQRSGGNNRAMTGGYTSSFALSREGLFWGGDGGMEPSGGVALRVAEQDDTGNVAKVRGGSLHAVQLGFGETFFIPLAGYQYLPVSVDDITSTTNGAVAGITSGSGERSYFLPPGHIVVREVSANLTWTWLGQALGLDGQPLSGAQVLNQSLPALDETGRFTLQSQTRIPALWLLYHGQVLRCPLTVKTTRDILQIVGQTRCVPAGLEGLPQALKLTPRVIRLLNTASR